MPFRLRDYQISRVEESESQWGNFQRQLLVMATGTGKTRLMGRTAQNFNSRGKKTLMLANRIHLVEQTAQGVADETGLNVDIEMGNASASPYADVVVASPQTLSQLNRLTSFSHDHFGCLIEDEAHLAEKGATWLRIRNWFFFGPDSLTEGWKAPPNVPPPRGNCCILGCTATPTDGLGAKYDYNITSYSLLDAVDDGWLVPIEHESIPLKIDIRGLKSVRTQFGQDFKPADLDAKIAPVIDKMAEQLAIRARDRKTIAFLPSVRTSEMFAEACERHGLRGIFASGYCLDKSEKTDAFRASGRGTVLSNCSLVNFGVDFPDVDCIFMGSATRSKTTYRQRAGRGTRVLKGVVDGLDTPEQRRAAIAASAKPNLLILDPFFIHERIDLCEFYDLVAESPEVKERMKNSDGTLKEKKERAERDELRALEKEARRVARKEARVIDPLTWGVSIGDDRIAAYVPEKESDRLPPLDGQIDYLKRAHIDVTRITSRGLAERIIGIHCFRYQHKFATPQQLHFLGALGEPPEIASRLRIWEASKRIEELKRQRGWR